VQHQPRVIHGPVDEERDPGGDADDQAPGDDLPEGHLKALRVHACSVVRGG